MATVSGASTAAPGGRFGAPRATPPLPVAPHVHRHPAPFPGTVVEHSIDEVLQGIQGLAVPTDEQTVQPGRFDRHRNSVVADRDLDLAPETHVAHEFIDDSPDSFLFVHCRDDLDPSFSPAQEPEDPPGPFVQHDNVCVLFPDSQLGKTAIHGFLDRCAFLYDPVCSLFHVKPHPHRDRKSSTNESETPDSSSTRGFKRAGAGVLALQDVLLPDTEDRVHQPVQHQPRRHAEENDRQKNRHHVAQHLLPWISAG